MGEDREGGLVVPVVFSEMPWIIAGDCLVIAMTVTGVAVAVKSSWYG